MCQRLFREQVKQLLAAWSASLQTESLPSGPCARWDGLVRLCFGRKNKTLGGIFRQAPTLALLEANHAVHAALAVCPGDADAGAANALAAMGLGEEASHPDPNPREGGAAARGAGEDSSDAESEAEGAGPSGAAGMDVDGRTLNPRTKGPAGGDGRGGGRRGKRGRASEGFKERVLGVLRGGGFEEARSAKLAQDDFMRLLAAFNRAGIHFA